MRHKDDVQMDFISPKISTRAAAVRLTRLFVPQPALNNKRNPCFAYTNKEII